jgi:hypothetical protein
MMPSVAAQERHDPASIKFLTIRSDWYTPSKFSSLLKLNKHMLQLINSHEETKKNNSYNLFSEWILDLTMFSC